MDNGNGDLVSIVESCSKLKMATDSTKNVAPSDLLCFLPSADKVTTMTSSSDTMSRRDFEGLEELCMPFLSRPQLPQPLPPQKTEAVANLKRRKKRQKNVVMQVPIDNSDDSWAWRKYGQKAIKGSPYSRAYYRCSTSKNCPATKQVERSYTEPTMLIISYAEEHNHPMPAHRDSISGTTTKDILYDRDGNDRPLTFSTPTTLLTTSMSMEKEEGKNEAQLQL